MSTLNNLAITATTRLLASRSEEEEPYCTTATPGPNGNVPVTACNAYYNYDPQFAPAVAVAVIFGILTGVHVVQAIIFKKVRRPGHLQGNLYQKKTKKTDPNDVIKNTEILMGPHNRRPLGSPSIHHPRPRHKRPTSHHLLHRLDLTLPPRAPLDQRLRVHDFRENGPILAPGATRLPTSADHRPVVCSGRCYKFHYPGCWGCHG